MNRQRGLNAVSVSLILLSASLPLFAAEWHVAPDGGAGGDGSAAKPWSLKAALEHPATVKPGDTIWLHEGTYTGHFQGNLKGTPEAPIIVRQYPGERAIIDGNFNRLIAGNGSNVFGVAGAWTWYWGFEITSSYAKRSYDKADYGIVDRPWGLDVGNNGATPGIKLINLVIHDTSQGPGVWNGATDQELCGCIIFNNGYDAPDRGHGHGTYTQNQTTTRRIVDNIIFNQYSYGIHAYGSARAFLNNFHIEGNILFGNGAASSVSGYTTNILIGGGRVAEKPVIRENYSYYPPAGKGGVACQLNYGQGSADAVVRDNYFVSGGPAFTLKGNVFVGPAQGFDAAAHPDNTFQVGRPAGTRAFVRPNKYEPKRAHICVFNWDKADKVAVDLSGVLKPGDAYEVRDVQNILGGPVLRGTFEGKAIEVPMDLTAVTQPMGAAKQIQHTPREFNAFLVTGIPRLKAGR